MLIRKNCCLQAAVSILVLALYTGMALPGNNQASANDLQAFEAEFNKLAKDSKEFKEFIGIAQMALRAFGYGAEPFNGAMDDKTISAFQQYQKHRGLNVTAKPDAATVKTLLEDFNEWMRQIPYLPPLTVLIDGWDTGYVRADGTWVMEQDRMAFPMQTTRIQCYRASQECVAGTAQFTGKGLSSDIEHYAIERWDKHEIVLAPKDYQCVRYTVRILKAQKSVTASRIKTNDNSFCKETQAELKLRLEDGMKVYKQLSKEREEKMNKFLRLPFLISDSAK